MKFRRTSKALLYALLLCIGPAAFLSSCKKEDDIELVPPPQAVMEEEPCEPLPYWQGSGFRPAIIDSFNIRYPLVNPHNPNEMIFQLVRDNKVYKLNLVTGEVNVVIEQAIGYVWPHWGSNDWLLYTRMQNLYKVKTNGDSLTQLTFQGVGWQGAWNPKGDKYTYITNSSQGGFMRVVANAQDAILDTLPVVLNQQVHWVTEDTLFLHGRMYIMGNDEVDLIYEVPTGQTGFVAPVSRNELYILTTELMNFTVQTGEMNVTPVPGSDCKTYFTIAYSSQKQMLFSSEMYRLLMPDGVHQYFRERMVWLNLDGTVHEAIDISPFFSE